MTPAWLAPEAAPGLVLALGAAVVAALGATSSVEARLEADRGAEAPGPSTDLAWRVALAASVAAVTVALLGGVGGTAPAAGPEVAVLVGLALALATPERLARAGGRAHAWALALGAGLAWTSVAATTPALAAALALVAVASTRLARAGPAGDALRGAWTVALGAAALGAALRLAAVHDLAFAPVRLPAGVEPAPAALGLAALLALVAPALLVVAPPLALALAPSTAAGARGGPTPSLAPLAVAGPPAGLALGARLLAGLRLPDGAPLRAGLDVGAVLAAAGALGATWGLLRARRAATLAALVHGLAAAHGGLCLLALAGLDAGPARVDLAAAARAVTLAAAAGATGLAGLLALAAALAPRHEDGVDGAPWPEGRANGGVEALLGLGRRAPGLGLALVVLTATIVGLPPTVGFAARLAAGQAALAAGHVLGAAAAFALLGLGADVVARLARVAWAAPPAAPCAAPAPGPAVLALGLAGLALALGLLPGLVAA